MITFNGVEFHERGYRFAPGEDAVLGVKREGLIGFQDSAEAVGERTRVSGSHGEYDGPTFLTGVVRTISGVALARSRGRLQWMRDQMTALTLAGTQRLVWERDEFGESSRWCYARVLGAVEWRSDPHRRPGGYWCADFTVQLHSALPWWYGASRSYTVQPGRAVEVAQYGTAPAFPTYEVTGPADWWGFRVGDSDVTGPGSLRAGETVRLDALTGVGTTGDGALIPGLRGTIPLVQPGVQMLHMLGTGTGSARVTITETFV